MGIAGSGDTRAGGYSVEQPWLRATQPGMAPQPGLVTRSVGAKPLQTPGAYGDILRDQERTLKPSTGPGRRGSRSNVAQGRAGGSRDSRRVLTSAAPQLTASSDEQPSEEHRLTRTTSCVPPSRRRPSTTHVRAWLNATSTASPATNARPAAHNQGIPPATCRALTATVAEGHQHRPQGACVRQRHPRTTDKDTLLFELAGNSDAVERARVTTRRRATSRTTKQFISDSPYGAVTGTGRCYKVTIAMSHRTRAAMSDNMFTGSVRRPTRSHLRAAVRTRSTRSGR
jgi:hypothetical protein